MDSIVKSTEFKVEYQKFSNIFWATTFPEFLQQNHFSQLMGNSDFLAAR